MPFGTRSSLHHRPRADLGADSFPLPLRDPGPEACRSLPHAQETVVPVSESASPSATVRPALQAEKELQPPRNPRKRCKGVRSAATCRRPRYHCSPPQAHTCERTRHIPRLNASSGGVIHGLPPKVMCTYASPEPRAPCASYFVRAWSKDQEHCQALPFPCLGRLPRASKERASRHEPNVRSLRSCTRTCDGCLTRCGPSLARIARSRCEHGLRLPSALSECSVPAPDKEGTAQGWWYTRLRSASRNIRQRISGSLGNLCVIPERLSAKMPRNERQHPSLYRALSLSLAALCSGRASGRALRSSPGFSVGATHTGC